MGVKCYNLTAKTGKLLAAKIISDDQEIMLITTEGIIMRMNADDISLIGRDTSGVKVINLEENTYVASLAKVRDMEGSEEDSEESEDAENIEETEETTEE